MKKLFLASALAATSFSPALMAAQEVNVLFLSSAFSC